MQDETPLANGIRIVKTLRIYFHLLDHSFTHQKKEGSLPLFLGSGLDRLDSSDQADGVEPEGVNDIPANEGETVFTGDGLQSLSGESCHLRDLVGVESVVEQEGEHLESLPLLFREVFDVPRTEGAPILELRHDQIALAGRFRGLRSFGSGIGGDGDNRLGNLDLEALGGEGGESGEEVGGEHSSAFRALECGAIPQRRELLCSRLSNNTPKRT